MIDTLVNVVVNPIVPIAEGFRQERGRGRAWSVLATMLDEGQITTMEHRSFWHSTIDMCNPELLQAIEESRYWPTVTGHTLGWLDRFKYSSAGSTTLPSMSSRLPVRPSA